MALQDQGTRAHQAQVDPRKAKPERRRHLIRDEQANKTQRQSEKHCASIAWRRMANSAHEVNRPRDEPKEQDSQTDEARIVEGHQLDVVDPVARTGGGDISLRKGVCAVAEPRMVEPIIYGAHP